MTYLTYAVSIFGTLGLGSVLGQYLTGGRERRQVRSDVLHRIFAVEEARWEKDNYPQFVDATRQLEAASLVARIPRTALAEYIDAAGEFRRTLYDPGDPEIGFIQLDQVVEDAVVDAAEDLARLVWSWSPLTGRARVAIIKRRRARLNIH